MEELRCLRCALILSTVQTRRAARPASRARRPSRWDRPATLRPADASPLWELQWRPPSPTGTGQVSPQFTRKSLGDPEVVGRRDLEVVRRIGNQLHRKPRALAHLGVIAWRPAICGGAQPSVSVV